MKLSEREWLEQWLDPPEFMQSVQAHSSLYKYVAAPRTVTSWDVMAAIHSHLEAAASEPPLKLPLDQDMWLSQGGSNEAAVTLFVQMVTRCVSLVFTAA